MRQGSEGKRSFGNLSPDVLPFLFMLIMVILTAYNLLFSTLNLFNVIKIKSSLHHLDRRLAEIKSKNDKLENMLELVKKDPNTYRERFIREYMQLQKSDEKIILFDDERN